LEELTELDTQLTATVLKLKKVVKICQSMTEGRSINKHTLIDESIANYKIAKVAKIKHELQQNASSFNFESDDLYIDVRKTKKTPKKKRNTYEETLELLHQGNAIDQIARIRQLSQTTINSHFAVLLKAEKIELNEVMTDDRIKLLQELIEDIQENSLSAIKERNGDAFTWDELKLYQASCMK
jgi:uncharacterized protein YpbB